MTEPTHPAVSGHLPPFVSLPGETDTLFVFVAFLVVFGVLGIGIFYFKLHALPEQLAHKGQKVQFEIVAVLGLVSLFTHNHAYWIAGLLLAIVPLPDFTSPLRSIANSLDRLADAATADTTTADTAPRAVPFPVNEAPATAPHTKEPSPPDHRPTGPQGV